jgi:hypothetical protein
MAEMNLLPCPFCGAEMKVEGPSAMATGAGAGELYVICDCGAMGAGGKNPDGAIEAWNRRTAPASAPLDTPNERKSEFLTHLAESGKAVEGWPEWKTGLWKTDSATPLDTQALPPPEYFGQGTDGSDMHGYTAEQVRQIIAPYAERIRTLEAAYDAATSLAGDTINARNAEVAEQAARIRHLERELDYANGAYQGCENSRKADEVAVSKILYGDKAAVEEARRAMPALSIDTPEFRDMLFRFAREGMEVAEVVAYIDGRTAPAINSKPIAYLTADGRHLIFADRVDTENAKHMMPLVDGRTAGAAPKAPDPTEAAIEARAKEIYASFVFADRYPWVDGGNSIRQDDARDQARKEFAAAPSPLSKQEK